MSVNAPETQVDTSSGTDVVSPTPHLYVTLDEADHNVILELVRVDGENYYIRDSGEWVPIDPNADNERVWDRIVEDVTPSAVPVFDKAAEAGNGVAHLSDIQRYVIPD